MIILGILISEILLPVNTWKYICNLVNLGNKAIWHRLIDIIIKI